MNKINYLFFFYFRLLDENKNGVMMIMGNDCYINFLNYLFYYKYMFYNN